MEAIAQPPTTFRLTPRPYQYEAVAALLAATARGVNRPLLVLPTGTGKTIVFALLVQRRRGRSLILAHRDELIQQAVDKLHLVDPTLALGVVQAARDEHTAPVVVASVQTLSRRTRLAHLVPNFQTIVIGVNPTLLSPGAIRRKNRQMKYLSAYLFHTRKAQKPYMWLSHAFSSPKVKGNCQ
jgi:superfamily II DNA or RNA helicase